MDKSTLDESMSPPCVYLSELQLSVSILADTLTCDQQYTDNYIHKAG